MTVSLEPRPSSTRARVAVFAAILALCLIGGGAYVLVAAAGDDATTTPAQIASLHSAPASLKGRSVLVRAADPEDPGLDGGVAVARIGGGRPRPTGLSCQRSYFAGGRGICLALASSGVGFNAIVFDGEFDEIYSLALDGLPSRARVSPDGRLGAVTSFVTGHSYAETGAFSTSTRLIDLRRGRWLANLEEFAAYKDGHRIEAPDFNYWGVTFERGGRDFYATLATGEHRYLVHGNVAERRVDVLRDRVECPSLSPDGTRLAYKRTLGDGRWRPWVYDLENGTDHPLAETRSIDDQIEWLDDDYVLYGDGSDVFLTAADGTGRPQRLMARAASPTALN